jgi:hypothetical protein
MFGIFKQGSQTINKIEIINNQFICANTCINLDAVVNIENGRFEGNKFEGITDFYFRNINNSEIVNNTFKINADSRYTMLATCTNLRVSGNKFIKAPITTFGAAGFIIGNTFYGPSDGVAIGNGSVVLNNIGFNVGASIGTGTVNGNYFNLP